MGQIEQTVAAYINRRNRDWRHAETMEIDPRLVAELRAECEAAEAVAEFDYEPTTQPIPYETCAQLVFGTAR